MCRMSAQITVELGSRRYPIIVGPNLLGDPKLIAPFLPARQVCIVSNTVVAPLYLDTLIGALDGREVDTCILPDGENHKTLSSYATVIDHLIAHHHNRSTTLIALGGGVVGDITGFVAATYQRGVAFIQIPTTLLAQVDSSVGGKTAVNHPRGKNMIGAFYQPRLVLADLDVLASLPSRDYLCGIAEIIKYGVIRDRAFFEWLEANVDALLRRDVAALAHAVMTSCSIKAEIVAADEREEGERAILNFGHTFGHAIENLTTYEYAHGEAVAIGMVMASDLSMRLGWLERGAARRIKALIEAFGLPVSLPANLAPTRIREVMGMDKKVRDGQLRLVLARALGAVHVSDNFDPQALATTLSKHDAFCDG
jgi:3-dehydroquinate synthase